MSRVIVIGAAGAAGLLVTRSVPGGRVSPRPVTRARPGTGA